MIEPGADAETGNEQGQHAFAQGAGQEHTVETTKRVEAPAEAHGRGFEPGAFVILGDEGAGGIQLLAQLPFVSGFCYTQLTDIEQEINGLMTYDRKPKIDPERVAAAHRKVLAAING